MPHINNVWRERLAVSSRSGGRVIVAILVISAAISGLGTVKNWIFPPPPLAVSEIAQRTVNQMDLVKGFAIDCVTTYLTAAKAHNTDLARCFPNVQSMTIPAMPGLIVTAPVAHASRFGPRRGDFATYSVLVGVTEQAYATAAPHRNFYQIPVGVYGGDAVKGLDWMARIDAPPEGVLAELGYPVNISTTDPVGVMLTGFVNTFLTSTPGLERYITNDSQLERVKFPYATVVVKGITAASTPPKQPEDNATLSVRLTATAHSAEYLPADLSYPLTLRAAGGTWFVAGIDSVPALGGDDPGPPSAGER